MLMIARRLSMGVRAIAPNHRLQGLHSRLGYPARTRLGQGFGAGNESQSQNTSSAHNHLETSLARDQQQSTPQFPNATESGSHGQTQAGPRVAKTHDDLDQLEKPHSTIAALSNPDQIYEYLCANGDLTSAHLVTAVERIVKLRKLAVFNIRLLGKSDASQAPVSEGSTTASTSPLPVVSASDHPNPWKDPRFLFVLESISRDLDSLRPTDFIRLMAVLTHDHIARNLEVVTSLLTDMCQFVVSAHSDFQTTEHTSDASLCDESEAERLRRRDAEFSSRTQRVGYRPRSDPRDASRVGSTEDR